MQLSRGESSITKLFKVPNTIVDGPSFDSESQRDDTACATKTISVSFCQKSSETGELRVTKGIHRNPQRSLTISDLRVRSDFCPYLVPTMSSKKLVMGVLAGSSLSIALRTSSSTIPRTRLCLRQLDEVGVS